MISKNIIDYTPEQSTYCKPVLLSYSSLAEATVACDLDKQCEGIYDNCGDGSTFATCGPNLLKHKSDCGSLFYQKLNLQAGKIIIQLETMIS